MRVATWNVNSVRARLARVVAWVRENHPDVLCLQETKVVDADFPRSEFEAAGYRLALHGQKTYNGVAILSLGEMADVTRGFADGGDDSQARLVAATTLGVRAVCAYVPMGQAVESDKFAIKLEWLRRLRTYLEVHHRKDEPLVLCGDFNVAPEPRDVHDPVAWEGQVLCTPEERSALEHLRAWGFVDTFRRHHPEPGCFTWWDYRQLAFPRDHGLRLDHIWATPPLAERCTGSAIDRDARRGALPSDHAPVISVFDAGR